MCHAYRLGFWIAHCWHHLANVSHKHSKTQTCHVPNIAVTGGIVIVVMTISSVTRDDKVGIITTSCISNSMLTHTCSWYPPVPPMTTKLASWQLLGCSDNHIYPYTPHHTSCAVFPTYGKCAYCFAALCFVASTLGDLWVHLFVIINDVFTH